MTAMEPQSTAVVLARFLTAVLVIAATGRVLPADTPSAVEPAHAVGSEPASSHVRHYGILGPVGRPGVYASVHDDLTLAELVAAAGGTTPQAAGAAQVIRRGHTGPRLNCSPPSTARLKPGDVVVVERSSAEAEPRSDQWVPVALVGLAPETPIVVMLPNALAEVPHLISALQQQPVLIESVRILRPATGQPPHAAIQPTTRLREGDIVVFDPDTIDRPALARAESFPPPVLIPERKQSGNLEITIRPQQPLAGGGGETEPIAASSAAGTPSPIDERPEEIWPLRHPGAEDSEHAALPPLALPEALKSPSPLADERGSLAADEADTPGVQPDAAGEPADAASSQRVVAASLAQALPQSAREEDRFDAVLTAREPERMAASHDTNVMAVPGERLSRSVHVPVGSDMSGAATLPAARPANIAATADTADAKEAPGFGMRAFTVGITVLATALICFAASLLWSRLDDSTGLAGAVAHNEDQLPIHTRTAGRETLSRLINNELPIIEEPTLLPESADFHGEAVGRRRLRIDAEQHLSGPHFAAAQQTSEPEAVPETAGTANTRPNREDSSADGPSGDAVASSRRGTRQGGLLDRVLVAMEREKRR